VETEEQLLGQLAAPSQSLGEVAVKLAYAYRVGWYSMHGNGPYGEGGLALLASSLSAVILLREAEVERRHRIEEDGR
jgi:hypothetical protein